MKLLAIIAALLLSSEANVLNKRIIGGNSAKINQFPYQVSVQARIFWIYSHICGGSVIGLRYVLTAANCIITNDLRVRGGVLRLTDGYDVGQTIDVHRAFIHPGFNDTDVNKRVTGNDIAVLRLSEQFSIGDGIQIINLPRWADAPMGSATISGWGLIHPYADLPPNRLHYANVTMITNEECSSALIAALGNTGPLDDTMICTMDDNTDNCNGDTGGPLVQGSDVIGVVSWGIRPCGRKGRPAVYGRVNINLNWIQEQMIVG